MKTYRVCGWLPNVQECTCNSADRAIGMADKQVLDACHALERRLQTLQPEDRQTALLMIIRDAFIDGMNGRQIGAVARIARKLGT